MLIIAHHGDHINKLNVFSQLAQELEAWVSLNWIRKRDFGRMGRCFHPHNFESTDIC